MGQILTAAEARRLFSYDPLTGEMLWRVDRNKMKAGEGAGSVSRGYLNVMVDGTPYKVHRVIWLIMTGAWPAAAIDHRDGDGLNNAWVNLREATSSQNNMNRHAARGISGAKGVFLDKRDGRWYARVTVNRKHVHLGRFATREEAAAAYAIGAAQHHGEFACPIR